jgi:hypothetical protein
MGRLLGSRVLALIVLGMSGFACTPPPLALDVARTSTGDEMTVAAAAFGDDFVQLMAQKSDCSEFIAYRNFPSWQFDSCETCFGGPIGSGLLSTSAELCGHASGEGWESVGDCGAALTVAATTSEELSGTLRVEKSNGGSVVLEFRAARRTLTERPTTSHLATLCDARTGGVDAAVCCNWARDESCAQASLRAACSN